MYGQLKSSEIIRWIWAPLINDAIAALSLRSLEPARRGLQIRFGKGGITHKTPKPITATSPSLLRRLTGRHQMIFRGKKARIKSAMPQYTALLLAHRVDLG